MTTWAKRQRPPEPDEAVVGACTVTVELRGEAEDLNALWTVQGDGCSAKGRLLPGKRETPAALLVRAKARAEQVALVLASP